MFNFKKNDIVELCIEDINNLGAGVSHLEDGRVVFIRGAVTGDKIKAKIIKINTNFVVARLEELIEFSPFRDIVWVGSLTREALSPQLSWPPAALAFLLSPSASLVCQESLFPKCSSKNMGVSWVAANSVF